MSTKEYQAIQGQLDELQQRRAEIIRERAELATNVQKLETSVGASLLARKGVDKAIGEISRSRVHIEGLEEAQAQIEKQISVKQAELAQAQHGIEIEEYESLVAGAREKLYACVHHLDAVNELLESIDLPSAPKGYHSADAALVTNMLGHMQALGIFSALQLWGEMDGGFVQAARGEKAVPA